MQTYGPSRPTYSIVWEDQSWWEVTKWRSWNRSIVANKSRAAGTAKFTTWAGLGLAMLYGPEMK